MTETKWTPPAIGAGVTWAHLEEALTLFARAGNSFGVTTVVREMASRKGITSAEMAARIRRECAADQSSE